MAAGLSHGFALGSSTRLRLDLAYLHLFLRERDIAPSDQIDAQTGRPLPGSDRTILNKPAPSFFYGVTRASVSLLNVSGTLLF